jgi:DNA-directed RNA polymerase subunit K
MAKQEKPVEVLTKYEKARLIGARALQIALGAPFAVKVDEAKLKEIKYNPIEIAKMELEAGVLPISISRKMPKKLDREEELRIQQDSGVSGSIPEDV